MSGGEPQTKVSATVRTTKGADPQAHPSLLSNVRNLRFFSGCQDTESAH